MDADNHPSYTEVDAASQGAVSDVRMMKDFISYRTGSDKTKILCYDESHMLSTQAQNALLQTLEEGVEGVLFVFCTTESGKMLPTIKSRCVELQMKLLTMPQIHGRLQKVAQLENIQVEDKALRIVSSYVRGHARDALVMLEQLSKMADVVTEDLVRRYLKLDRYVEVYQLLCETDKKEAVIKLEALLCNYAPSELAEAIGEVLLNAYKLGIGVADLTAIDKAWIQKIRDVRSDSLLDTAERILTLQTDYSTITYAMAAFTNVLFEGKTSEEPANRTAPMEKKMAPSPAAVASVFRKPGR